MCAVHITPQRAGWAYSGLTVYDLAAGPVEADLGPDEAVLVPLSAQDVRVRVDGRSFSLAGREGVFSAVSDWLYVPLGARLELHGDSGEVAVCTARASRRLPARHVPADQVAVEVRGAGRATRQVTNIATPDSFPDADRINVCEVITPGGNLSSWPPHRHDGLAGCPTSNEEIYYFRIGRTGPGGDSTPDTCTDTRTVGPLPRLLRRWFGRRDGHAARWRRLPGAARLPRSDGGPAGVPDVLPQRARRPGSAPHHGLLRRPGARLDPGPVGPIRSRARLPMTAATGRVAR